MINFELFKKTIDIIKEQEDKDRQLQNLVGDGVCTYSCNITSSCINLLECEFNDTGKWIEWWILECDFGTKNAVYWPQGVSTDEKGVDISNPVDLYELLINNTKVDDQW